MTTHSDKGNPASCCRCTNVNGHEQLIFEVGGMPSAGPRITLRASPPSVLVEGGNGNSISLGPAGITIHAASKVTINASVAQVSASTVMVDSPTVNFSGVVHAETVIAQQVLRTGGNIW